MKVYKPRPVYKRKRDHEGKVVRHKARFTIAAYKRTMREGIDYQDKYASTAMWTTVLLIIWLALQNDWPIWLIDIATFFLYGKLPEDEVVYMHAFPGMEQRSGMVLQLLKSIYGLPSAAHHAQKKLHECLTKNGAFKQSVYDPCLYILDKSGAKFFLATHVDDGTCTGNTAGYEVAIKCLRSVFEITIEKNPKLILGVQLDRDFGQTNIKLHQTTYIKSMIKQFQLEDCKGRSTPMERNATGIILKKLRDAKDKGEQGRELDLMKRAGKLMYLKTRPDVSFAAGFVARFSKSAGDEEVKMATDIIRYLKEYPSAGILLTANKDAEMHWYVDADLAGDPTTAKSTSGIIGKDGAGNTIYFRSWLQKKVSDSTGMAETYAAHEACRLIKLYSDMWTEVGLKVNLPIKLYVDSANVLKLNKEVTSHHTSRHYRIAQAFIHEKVKEGLVELVYVPSEKNQADLLTKPLGKEFHHRHTNAVMHI